jgi:hypothetical protein
MRKTHEVLDKQLRKLKNLLILIVFLMHNS